MKHVSRKRIHATVICTRTLNKYGVGLESRQLKVLRKKEERNSVNGYRFRREPVFDNGKNRAETQ